MLDATAMAAALKSSIKAAMIATWPPATHAPGPTTAYVAGSPDLTFDGTAHTITRSAGSWLTDGFAVGFIVQALGTVSNNGRSNTITALTATVMTFVSGLTTEGPVSGANVIGGALGKPFTPEQIAGTAQAQDDFYGTLAAGIANGLAPYLTSAAVILPTTMVAPSGGGPVTGAGTLT